MPVQKANLKRNVKQLINKIENGKWLSDEHIDHAQAMLAKQYPGIGGLHAVCVFEPEGCQKVGTPEQDFIQVVNVSGNHWVTVSNVGCPKDTVAINDSLYDDVSAMGKEKFLTQVAYMLMSTSKCMTQRRLDSGPQSIMGNEHVRPHSRFDRAVNISLQIESGDVLTARKFDKILFDNGVI